MKNKIKLFIIALIGLFTLPLIAKADVGAPENYRYHVIISNQKGAAMYDWETKKIGVTIPFDTKIEVMFESTMNEELYLDVSYKNNYGYIKAKDVKVYEEEIDFSQMTENKSQEQYYTLEKTDMYKGPSTVYGKIDKTIPAGEIIDYTYKSADTWSYVEYEGTKGWVYSYFYTESEIIPNNLAIVAKDDENRLFIIPEEAELHKTQKADSEVIKTIKGGKEYIYKYQKNLKDLNTAYYIEDGDTKGWVINKNPIDNKPPVLDVRGNEAPFVIMVKEGLQAYKEHNDEKPIKNLTIPYLTYVIPIYSYTYKTSGSNASYLLYKKTLIKYEDKFYWIDHTTDDIVYGDQAIIKTKKAAKLYKEHELETSSLEIPKGTELTTLMNVWRYSDAIYLVEYEGTKGWLKDLDIEIVKYIETEIEVNNDPLNPEEEKENKKNEKEEQNFTPKTIAILCVGGAVVLGLLAIVMIKLINKKKDKQEDINKETKE